MAFYHRAEERLVRSLMEDYQRRGMLLLQAGLHCPMQPEFFWDSGFDVTALDECQKSIDIALERSGPRISYQLGKLNYLPFDDDTFDYTFFANYYRKSYLDEFQSSRHEHTFIEKKFNTVFYEKNGILSELCRVSRLGVIIIAKNSFSLSKVIYEGKSLFPLTLWNQAQKYCPCGKVKLFSTGFLPRFFPQLSFINNAISILPLGALIGISLQFNAPTLSSIGTVVSREDACLG